LLIGIIPKKRLVTLSELKTYLINSTSAILRLKIVKYTTIETIIETVIENYYHHSKTSAVNLKGEIEMWKTKWPSSDKNTGNYILYKHIMC